ncbi:PEGA domain-containing protein [Methanospirillum sp.]|uniref:PEGA domain-containing protein n=1 Tax=Methanospirillum sp. TaxID=45200 RepID=UPI002BDBAA49|nr:PEGA domain-containing protein [Methanospirillum sp.]HPP78501.1 PEGA domain-containing protein [Methanospirillum sp.]
MTSPVLAEDKTGYFEVTSVPEGGDVFVGSQFMGETPVLIPAQNQSEGTRIRVMMQGFEIWEQTIAGTPASGQVVPIKASLIPVSPFGTLEVTSSPSGALVTVNNGMGQMTPWTYRHINTGTHLVSLFLSGFEPYVANVEVLPGQVTRLHANMTVRSGAGSLQVSTTPGSASVYVDGVFSGVTNTVIGNIPPGKHRILITKAGYENYEEWVVVSNRQVTSIQTSLRPVERSSEGALVITSDPPGASVFLDGQFKGTTETGRPLELTSISPGPHSIYLSIRNYEDYSTTVTVKPGEATPVSAILNPSPMPQDCGKLILNTEPAGAEIYVDGSFVGVTPATIDTVCSGTHTYRLVLPGYQEYSSMVELIPGQVLQVNTVLIPEPEHATGTPWPAVPVILIVLVASLVFFSKRG